MGTGLGVCIIRNQKQYQVHRKLSVSSACCHYKNAKCRRPGLHKTFAFVLLRCDWCFWTCPLAAWPSASTVEDGRPHFLEPTKTRWDPVGQSLDSLGPGRPIPRSSGTLEACPLTTWDPVGLPLYPLGLNRPNP